MSVARIRVSDRGRMALPAEARRRWEFMRGGVVEMADLGGALLTVPVVQDGVRAMLRDSIEQAGGYAKLAAEVVADDFDLG